MTEEYKQAVEVLDELQQSGKISYSDYLTIHDGLDDIPTLDDRDEELEDLWSQFGDVPMNPETECIEEKFMGWEAGTNREEIWHWFDERYSKGIAALLYCGSVDEAVELAAVAIRNAMCFNCVREVCDFNENGLCRYPLVHGKRPTITEEDGRVVCIFAKGRENTKK